ncbi:aminotransferase class V-fold PLP-dependent enzyme [Daejeonella sp. H1SJ63]|uniref:aminotransferase class V-fold PLP-dependent enzyme n=1 Tax=Daejeonella sp. H1SJ63 TaxID=3034145 RepID=UPI0023EC4CC1|nr:aminotransferase class V-fold PLP-dependent enzyme [Daejeonella sp. H1SJ63]
MKRRNLIKGLALLPVVGNVLSSEGAELAAGQAGEAETTLNSFLAETNIYRSMGVEPIINCRGSYTIIGGSIKLPKVKEALEAASNNFVQLDELAEAVGKRLAELTKTEWGMVSSGCAAGVKHITAACVTGGSPERLIRIPDLTGFEKTEVIIPKYSRQHYDHAVRNIGVKIVTVATAAELEKAINSKTAMIYLTSGTPGAASDTGQPLSLEVIASIAKPKNIPILIDAAAESLTIPPVHLKRGADVVAYSGGKTIRGPQSAGLMLGNKNILLAAWQASAPHHGPGRDNKLDRDEIVGMVAAVENWLVRDHEGEWKRWLGWLDVISKKVSTISGMSTRIVEPTNLNNKYPVLHIIWNPEKYPVTGYEIAEEVGRSKPRIALGNRDEADGTTSIQITPGHMQSGEEKIVADRLYEVLSRKRSPKPEMAAPLANLSGRWDVEVQYALSTSQHSFVIEQDGNWIQGTHKGDMDTKNMAGTIDGDEVKIRSTIPIVGNIIIYLFSGKVKGDIISGDIHMGEYLTAKFTAKRNTTKLPRQKVMIPGGQPLAT